MENGGKFVSSIIFISSPDTSHIDLKDIERFKRLTVLENLFLDTDIEATLIRSYVDGALYDVIVHEAGHGIEFPPTSNRFSRERAKPADRIPHVVLCCSYLVWKNGMASLPSCQNYEKTQTFLSYTQQNPKQTTTHYFASLHLLSQPLFLPADQIL
uniref:Uncharacterized protein n=1 Tax=Salix viminalis TaxID=40686 RepID=A0A6N2LW93_SALVM